MIKGFLIGVIVYIIVGLILDNLLSKSTKFSKRLRHIQVINKPNVVIEDELELSFQDRVLRPLVDWMIQAVALMIPIKDTTKKELEDKLLKAGLKVDPKDYRAKNIIVISALGIIGMYLGFSIPPKLINGPMYSGIGMAAGYILRRFDLEKKISMRKQEVKSQLPDVMDILSVSVVAGLSFDQALGHVVERSAGPLIDEFFIARREITLGKPRKDALMRLAKRCEVPELQTFTNAIIQADELGISMQNVLNTQSEMIRTNYRQEIEEKAAKIPVKILIPMVVFIFPVIFIVLMAPAVPQIMKGLGG